MVSASTSRGIAVVSGQRNLRLVAARADGRHALAARFGSLTAGEVHHPLSRV